MQKNQIHNPRNHTLRACTGSGFVRYLKQSKIQHVMLCIPCVHTVHQLKRNMDVSQPMYISLHVLLTQVDHPMHMRQTQTRFPAALHLLDVAATSQKHISVFIYFFLWYVL